MANLPWWALLLGGIIFGWLLEWLLEILFFRRNRMQVGESLAADAQATLRAKDEELSLVRDDLHAKLDSVHTDLGEATKARLALDGQLKAKDTDLLGLRAKFSGLQAEFDKLKADHGLKLGEIATLTAAGATAAVALKAKDADLGKLRADWDASVKTKDGDLGKLRADWDAKLKAKDVELNGLNVKLGSLQGEFDKLKADHGVKLGEIATLTAAGATAGVALKGRDADLSGLKARIGELEGSLKTKDADLGKLRADWDAKLKAKDAELNGVNAKLGTLQADLTKLKADHGSKVGEIATLAATGATVAASLKGKDDELAGLRTRINDLNAQLKARNTELDDQTSRYSLLENNHLELDDAKSKLAARIAELQAQLKVKDADVSGVNTKLGSLQAEFDKLKADHGLKLGEIATLGAAGVAATATIKRKDDDLGGLRTRIGDLEATLKAKDAQIGDVNAKFNGLRGDFDAVGANKAKLEARIGDLEAQLRDRNAERDGLNARLGKLQSDFDGLRNDHGNRLGEIATLTAAGSAATAAIQARESELADLRTKLDEAERARAAMPQARTLTFNAANAEAAATQQGIEIKRSECPQHLSEIDGIGTVFEQRLYDYGVGTYWEVANLSDDDFRKALHLDDIAAASKTGTRLISVDFDAVRKSARHLAAETDSLGRTWLRGQPDDFEPIDGIGHVFELRLYNAGICTYEALIATSVERLAEICKGPKFNQPNYASWIEQAHTLLAARVAKGSDAR